MAATSTIGDLKVTICAKEGTPVLHQQLAVGTKMLCDYVTLGELEETSILLVRRASACYSWIPETCQQHALRYIRDEICPASDGGVGSGFKLLYYPSNFESPMQKARYCAFLVQRPSDTILWIRLNLGGFTADRLFVSSNHIWLNFCPTPAEASEIGIEVLHFGELLCPESISEDEAEWDLRTALGGMPFKEGQQLPCGVMMLGTVRLHLHFYPRWGRDTCALQVVPVCGLGTRCYSCTVDGTQRVGSGESSGENILVFPLTERFGHIHVKLHPEKFRAE
eukprot:gnl/TRDRNA2_/TRDRNA2_89493_c0_seq2.p1 gnl/TRDRNA2_/TRDRNA2_89493_c0~~gnl/TRDRNA2_/TRDRNA2_89493_c0_seq2.p1  ORF type:complete len:280 (+),score=27.29 gnl/TRDRNA2_/TRDRNA2_89493_c0_seq2:57-896(+)